MHKIQEKQVQYLMTWELNQNNMKAQQENLILLFMLISQERDVQRIFMEKFNRRSVKTLGFFLTKNGFIQ